MATNLVHNAGVNYTLYYNVLSYFKTIMNNHPGIKIVTQGGADTFDRREFPMYPIADVSILETTLDLTTTVYKVQLIVADKGENKRNESGEYNRQTIPFFGVDDDISIFNNTLGIINDLTSYTQRSVVGYEIDSPITCIPFVDRFNNGLCGWVSTFDLITHNNRDRCLFDLLGNEQVEPYVPGTLVWATTATKWLELASKWKNA